MPQPCILDGISMNIQEENSAHYFRVESESEQTLVEQNSFYENTDVELQLMLKHSLCYYPRAQASRVM